MKHVLVLICASLLPSALGSGYLLTISVDGVSYTGTGAGDSVIRQVNSPNPIKDPSSVDMSCGPGAANVTANGSARAKPGSTIGITWASGQPPGPWADSIGPIMTYIAPCPGSCSDFTSLHAEWYKIDQAGFDNSTNTSSPTWMQGTTFHVGKPYTMKLPADTPPGDYLLRHEVIGLQHANAIRGAEFYPACSQITVDGPTSVSSDITVGPPAAFPGAYNYRDPGILIDVSNLAAGQYPFPGPKLITAFTSGGSGGNNSSAVPSDTSATYTSGGSVTAMATSTTASQLDTATITPPPTTTSQRSMVSDPTSTSASSEDGASSDDDSDCGGDDPDDADDDPDGRTLNGSDDGTDDGPDGSTGDSLDDSSDLTTTFITTVFVTAATHQVHTVIATTLVTVTPGDPAATAASASATADPSADDVDGPSNSRRGNNAPRPLRWARYL